MRNRLQQLGIGFIILLVGFSSSAWAAQEHLLSGRTMGTRYHIKVVADKTAQLSQVKERIDQRLELINQSMSTYRADSEISRFNALQKTNKPFAVSKDFLYVMQAGHNIHRLSQGAWDGTIQPLVKLWGFGKGGPIKTLPTREAIARHMQKVDFKAVEISPSGFLTKHNADITVDLASIAKGYGVDQVASLLWKMGFGQFLIEIGGEVFAAGRRADGKPWRVGINRPDKGGAPNAVYKAVALQDQAMATSGDYRNFIEIEGRTYSHIIDPRSGMPVNNGVVSASVIAGDCTMADGLATGLMVMGPQTGLALLDGLDGVEGLIVVRKPDGELVNHWSKGLRDAGR